MFIAIKHEEYERRLEEKNIQAIPLEKYITAKTKIKHLCLKHNVEFYAKPDALLQGRFPCPICKKEKYKANGVLLKKDPIDYIERVKNINPYIHIISDYDGANKPISYVCTACGFEGTTTASNLLKKRECTKCKRKSKSKYAEKKYKINLFQKFPNISYIGNFVSTRSKLNFKCNNDNYEWVSSANTVLHSGCPVCNGNKRNTYTYIKELEKLGSFVYPIEECGKSRDKIKHKCDKCGYIFSVSPGHLISKLHNNLGICPNCSEGISYPNKILHCLLDQLSYQLDSYQFEFSPDWCIYYDFKKISHRGRYDAECLLKNGQKIILEMDGSFHSLDNTLSGQSKELSQFIDKQKDSLAYLHGYKLIRIDCNYLNADRFEYIKNSILNNIELTKIFNITFINWNKILADSEKSYFIETCKMWECGNSIKEISEKIGLGTDTIRDYLNRGAKNGLCNYEGYKEYEKNLKNIRKNNSKSCICLETKEIFNSVSETGKITGINPSSISLCCNGKRKTAGNKTWAFYIKKNAV